MPEMRVAWLKADDASTIFFLIATHAGTNKKRLRRRVLGREKGQLSSHPWGCGATSFASKGSFFGPGWTWPAILSNVEPSGFPEFSGHAALAGLRPFWWQFFGGVLRAELVVIDVKRVPGEINDPWPKTTLHCPAGAARPTDQVLRRLVYGVECKVCWGVKSRYL